MSIDLAYLDRRSTTPDSTKSLSTRSRQASSTRSLKDLDNADEVIITASQTTSARASPAPQGILPNGKPSTPYSERNNPMATNGSIAANTVSSKDPKTAAQAASDMKNVVRRKLTGYVGFANLPNQWHRKSVRKGFNFNVMVVGKSRVNHQFPQKC